MSMQLTPAVRRFLGLDEFDAQARDPNLPEEDQPSLMGPRPYAPSAAPPDEVMAPLTAPVPAVPPQPALGADPLGATGSASVSASGFSPLPEPEPWSPMAPPFNPPPTRIQAGPPLVTGDAPPLPSEPSFGELVIRSQSTGDLPPDLSDEAQSRAAREAARPIVGQRPSVRPSAEQRAATAETGVAPTLEPGLPALPGVAGRRLGEAVTEARQTGQPIGPWRLYEAFSELPFDVYQAARERAVLAADRGLAGTDPLAPFRGLGIELPSAQEINPEGRPADVVLSALLLSGLIPDPADPYVGMAFRGAGRAIGATGRRLAAEGRTLATLADDAAEGASRLWQQGRQVADDLNARPEPATYGTVGSVTEASTAQTIPPIPTHSVHITSASEVVDEIRRTGMTPPARVVEMIGARPDYLTPVAQTILEQRRKVVSGTMTPRDVAKAYYMTVASQGSDAIRVSTVETKVPGFKVPPQFWSVERAGDASPLVRPEEAAAAWLFTARGQRALDAIERGVFDADAWAEGALVRRAFGDDRFQTTNVFGGRAPVDGRTKFNMQTLQAFTDGFNDLAQRVARGEAPAQMLDRYTKRLNGVREAKAPFLLHALGFGDSPTIDAVEINTWLTGKGDISRLQTKEADFVRTINSWLRDARVGQALRERIGEQFDEVRRLLPPDQTADLPPEVFNHVLHHWIWDRMKGTATTHEGFYNALRLAATAGPVPGIPGDGALPAVNRVLSEGIAGGVGGAVVEQARNPDEDPRTAAARGFAAGAVGFPLATRAIRATAGSRAAVGGGLRVVPPGVADTLDFPVRVPQDPAVIRAIKAVGGEIDPERGVTLHVTRAQGPQAAGAPATRGGVFYEAVPPGGKSSFMRPDDDPLGIGGSQVIPPTPTRFRSPLVLDNAPGENAGFDDAMTRIYGEGQAGWADDINGAIRMARGAGPEGSTARAEALREVVRRYGGDDALIEPLLRVRGADASESAWAIKENILAAHARRNGYDGIVTIADAGPDEMAVLTHPKVKAAETLVNDASAAYEDAIAAFEAHQTRLLGAYARGPGEDFQVFMRRAQNAGADFQAAWVKAGADPRLKELSDAMNRAEDAAKQADAVYAQAQAEARAELPSARITELFDVRQAANPTPGQRNPKLAEAEARFNELDARLKAETAQARAEYAANPQHRPSQEVALRRGDLVAEHSAAKRALDDLRASEPHFLGEPGYALREDVPRRPDSETALGTTGIAPSARILTDAANSLGGGVFGAATGAALPAETDEERRQNAIRGAAIGMVGAPIAGRLMPRAGGAAVRLGFTGRPPSQAAAAATDPTMQRMAKQMSGQYAPPAAVNRRSLAERWAQVWTDDRAAIRTFQEAVSAKIGRPLTAGESVAELTRINPNSAAAQRLAEELGPALQRVGEDEDYLAQVLVHRHNVDVAREMGQRAYDAAITAGKSAPQASAAAIRASNTRAFSGDLRLPETLQQLQAIEQRVLAMPDGAVRWKNIQDGAQSVWDFNRRSLERKRDAGIIDQGLYDELTQRYPHYARTDIADYFDKGAPSPRNNGQRIGISDIGIQKLSAEGTTKERVNPLLSTIEQAYASEAAITRNRAGQAFEELLRLDPSWQSTFKEIVPASGVNRGDPATTVSEAYTLRNGEQKLTIWRDGVARQFVVPREYAAIASPQAGRVFGDSGAANAWRLMMETYKGLITSNNPAFALMVSPVRDAGDYLVREATRSATKQGARGAVQAVGSVPRIMADYVRAVPDAFAGLIKGRYEGDLATLMREGAGMAGRPGHDQKELRQAVSDLTRTNGLQVRDTRDLLRVIGTVLTLGARPLGDRLEQVPRLAAARRAARRGAGTTEQVMAARSATIDFQQAGEWSRAANAVIPFFNVALQSGAQAARTARTNPAAFLAAVGATVGTATVAAEAWNRSDEQRAHDYDDVPAYLKKTGIVLMLPGIEGRSERGDRLPNYLWVPMGIYGAIVETAKESIAATAKGSGGPDLSTPSGWAEVAADIAGVFSPVRGDSSGAVLTSVTPPVLSTGLELAANRDLYRGATIATDQRDESASALARGSAGAWNAATGQETRPSQWEYLYRDLGGYGANLATSASMLLAEAAGQRRPKDESRPIQSAPVVGGLINRLIRDTGGARAEAARADSARVPESIRPILQEAGLRREEVSSVPSRYQGALLTGEEQAAWQSVTNALVADEVMAARDRAEWDTKPDRRPDLIRGAVARARAKAAKEALTDLSAAEIRERIQIEQSRKAG